MSAGKMMKLAPDLSALVNLCKSVRFQSFQHSFEKRKLYNMYRPSGKNRQKNSRKESVFVNSSLKIQ